MCLGQNGVQVLRSTDVENTVVRDTGGPAPALARAASVTRITADDSVPAVDVRTGGVSRSRDTLAQTQSPIPAALYPVCQPSRSNREASDEDPHAPHETVWPVVMMRVHRRFPGDETEL